MKTPRADRSKRMSPYHLWLAFELVGLALKDLPTGMQHSVSQLAPADASIYFSTSIVTYDYKNRQDLQGGINEMQPIL